MNLKSKDVLLVAWGCENPDDTYMYQIYYLMLKKIFPKLTEFDTKKNYFQFGKYEMNKNLIDRVDKEKPELILFALNFDEFSLETFTKIRESHPKSKLGIIICDDDGRFDSWSRYLALFFDFVITSQDFLKEYKKDGIEDVFFHLDYNTYKLKPINLKKIYDVTFIGRPKGDRNEIFKYLSDKGVKLSLFGWDWHNYLEFKKVYKGPLSQENYAKVINQSKINLSPTRAGYSDQKKRFNMKGRFFEVALCKSFQLIEDFPIIHKFFRKNEIGFFTTKEDLVKKIDYYLKHENEREKMAERAYKRVLKDYNREKQLIKIFTEVFKKVRIKKLPKSNKKIVVLTKKEISIENKEIKKKLKNIDYIIFNDGKCKTSEYKNIIQAISLEKTKKPISCCDYYVTSFKLDEYLLMVSKVAFERIGKEANRLININQLMAKKDFFLKNISLFKDLFKGREVNLINEKNTAFISIPLLTINKTNIIKYNEMVKAFVMKFEDRLFTLVYQKNPFNIYPYNLFLTGLFGKRFILRYLTESLFNQEKWDKLTLNKTYFRNSFFMRLFRKKS